jgi:tRNA A-37 threonylcarbamoyl transferase component Bud32
MSQASTTDRFSLLRDEFRRLCELDAASRTADLAVLARADAELADELARLLSNLDERDLGPPAAEDPTSLRFGTFRALRRVGSGGMGEVFEAVRDDAGFAQHVALKRVRHAVMSPELLRRFLRERQLLARLNHPGIARLIDGGVSEDGRPWLAMEYVEGLSLLRHAEHAHLDLRARVELIRRVCAPVAFAHRNLVVHRDLKPANVLVTPEGEPKLLDFGIAKLLDDSEVENTRAGLRALTLRYAAPEQISGDRTTTATDVYALGVLLFELAIGQSPYARAASGDCDFGQAVLLEAPGSISSLLADARRATPGLPGRRALIELDRIVHKALAKSPLARYESVAAFDADLEDWLAGRPLRSGIGSARAQAAWLVRRYRWPLALTAAVLLALGAGALAAWQQALRAEREAELAQAHLDALLDVLGSANPERFAGRDPTASEFLVAAAQRVIDSHSGDPALGRRALTEIGHALLNLGRFVDAERVLSAAWEAAAGDALASDASRLAILGLLIQAQDGPEMRQRARDTVQRIERLLASGTALDSADVIDALARAGGTLSRFGAFDEAERLFDLAQARMSGRESDHVRENFWRQRGWAALRAHQPLRAREYLAAAQALHAANPNGFVALRRAEGELLQAEAEIAAGAIESARPYLEAARVGYSAEYPSGHLERAIFDLMDARLLLAEERSGAALDLAQAAHAVLSAHPQARTHLSVQADCLLAEIHARMGNCPQARTAMESVTRAAATTESMLPREQAAVEQAHSTVQTLCTGV